MNNTTRSCRSIETDLISYTKIRKSQLLSESLLCISPSTRSCNCRKKVLEFFWQKSLLQKGSKLFCVEYVKFLRRPRLEAILEQKLQKMVTKINRSRGFYMKKYGNRTKNSAN